MAINNELRYGRTLWALVSVIATLTLIMVFIVYRVRVQRKEREVANSKQFIDNLQLKINQYTSLDTDNTEKALKSSTDIIRQLLNLSFLHGNDETLFYRKFSTIMSVKSNRKELLNVIMNVTEARHPGLFELIESKYPMLSENDVIFLGLSLGGFSYQELSVVYQIEHHSVVVRLSRIKKKICVCDDNLLTISDMCAR